MNMLQLRRSRKFKLSQSQLHSQLERPQRRPISLLPIPLKKRRLLTHPFSHLSALVMLSKSNLPQETSPQLKMILSREDTLQFFSPLLHNRRLSSPSTRTSLILTKCTRTQRLSDSSLRMLVSDREKLDFSIRL